MPKNETIDVPTRPETPNTTPESPPEPSKYGANLPQSFAAKYGMPPIPGPRAKFAAFVKYWRSIPADKRANVMIYVYALFPALNFPDKEHAIAMWPGENLNPVGGEKGVGADEEAVLNELGLGNFYMQLKYTDTGISRVILVCWLNGYDDNLPGWRDFNAHPPLYVRDPSKYLVLDDEKNIKSGYITFLKSKGMLAGNAGTPTSVERQREDSNMAVETAAQTTAVGILGKVIESQLERKDTPPAPVAQPSEPSAERQAVGFVLETAKDTMRMAAETMRQNAVNVPEMMKATAELMRPAPVVDTTTPLVVKMMEQSEKTQDTIAGLHAQRADDLRTELRETRADMRQILARLNQPGGGGGSTAVVAAEDDFTSVAKQLVRKKLESMLGLGGDDDEPAPRRRRNPDEDDEDAPKPKRDWMEIIATGVTMLPSLLSGINLFMHNTQAMRTGGETTAPLTSEVLPSYPGTHPTHPGQGPFNSPIPASGRVGPSPIPNQNPNPQGSQQQMMNEFLSRIEPSLIGSFERGETGYEYAETFIKAFGRSGMMGYSALQAIGAYNTNQQIPEPDKTVNTIAHILSQYQPIWNKIGTQVPRLREFLIQFLDYDAFLGTSRDLMAMSSEYGVGSVKELLIAVAEDEAAADAEENANGEGDGGDGDGADDPGDDSAAPAPAVAPTPQPDPKKKGGRIRKPPVVQ